MIAVTGATGHIGNVLVRILLNRGEEVKAVIPPDEDLTPLRGLKVEVATGDMRDPDSLMKALSGVEIVYHLAGIISILPGKKKVLEEVNVKGTRNVVEACLKNGIRRLVYVSSIHAVKEPPHGVTITESQPFDPQGVPDGYARSKARATLEVIRAIPQGLDAVIACPTGVIGPYDYKVSEMGQLIRNFVNRKLRIGVDGAYDFVDVRDVANGLVLACEKGRTGESYIFSGEQITIPDLLSLLEKATGIKAPSYKAPRWLARLAGLAATPYYLLSKAKPLFTAYSIDVLFSNSRISSEKARRELGYTVRSLADSITDTLSWYEEERKAVRPVTL
jgi:dihydroflavonol-4-reductase